ncbi:MAG: hypothetical protein ABSE51_19350 [Terracidiphilus sp.]|jgi:hypothetical protein
MIEIPNAHEFVLYLGRPENDPFLIAFLERFGSEVAPHKEAGRYESDISHLEVGVNFGFEDERLVFQSEGALGGTYLLMAVHLYSKGYQGSSGYDGALPENLLFSDSRESAHAKLGLPEKSGGGVKGVRRTVPFWDKYRYDRYSLHLTYNADSSGIALITLSANLGD